ncbi:hypothetical protein [Brevibacillus marinus]|uniref:hypothetical protein n=1 Tax=Brevibacillus marinus TaxID=2496837 RepID=UPI000F84BB2A|nr:hypothetical protein [Brevibacillus marinus]
MDKLRLMWVERDVTSGEPLDAQLIERGLFHPVPQRDDGSVDGLWIDGPVEPSTLMEAVGRLTAAGRFAEQPLLLLVLGHKVPYPFSLRLATRAAGLPVEVVRLFLVADGERAVLGGEHDGHWLHRLRHRLAAASVVSLVCGLAEAEEIAYGLTRFLACKQRFFHRLAERCDRLGVRFEQVAQGIGMDLRVGQGWLLPPRERTDTLQRQVECWLLRQLKEVGQKTNLSCMAIWGDPTRYPRLIEELRQIDQVRITSGLALQKPNNLPATWESCCTPLDTLDQADVLLILEADAAVRELDLGELVRRMRQPIVIDACACYPLVEAEAYRLMYRTFGQNTNVWNAIAYNRI